MATRYYRDAKGNLIKATGWQQALNNFFNIGSTDAGVGYGMVDSNSDLSALLGDVLNTYDNPVWNTLSDTEKAAILDNNYFTIKRGSGLGGDSYDLNYAQILRDFEEINDIGPAPTTEQFYNIDDIVADAQSQIDAENEKLLASLNAELKSTSDAYVQSRNALLAQQYMRNAQTVDAMTSEMSRARRNAIEAGASAGVRIASNVNTMLSAQNKMSQQSLETSNQLAQMLVNQRNAEAGLRNQWRDAEMSTYGRVQDRANSELNLAKSKYEEAQSNWQKRFDANVSASNPLRELFYTQKSNSAYKNNSGSAY